MPFQESSSLVPSLLSNFYSSINLIPKFKVKENGGSQMRLFKFI